MNILKLLGCLKSNEAKTTTTKHTLFKLDNVKSIAQYNVDSVLYFDFIKYW